MFLQNEITVTIKIDHSQTWSSGTPVACRFACWPFVSGGVVIQGHSGRELNNSLCLHPGLSVINNVPR